MNNRTSNEAGADRCDPAQSRIQICTFGTLQVSRGEHVVTEGDWHTRQARQLLKILITERPRPVATDRLIELLWPNSTVSAASTTLRSAINALRNVLEPERPNRAPSQYIHTQRPGYAYRAHPHLWLDVDAFEDQLDQAQRLLLHQPHSFVRRQHLEAAIHLYTDDYLASDPYADWAQTERERLRERFFEALLQLAELQAADGDYASAIATSRRILARDEVREIAYQALMRYQAEAGDSAGALLTYERCRAILAEELGADPSPLTQILHQRILNGEVETRPLVTSASLSVPASNAPSGEEGSVPLPQQVLMPVLDASLIDILVGREEEMRTLVERLDEAVSGEGVLVALAGEAGVGKTRMAYQLLQIAGEKGCTVISATCQALERLLPFAPLADSLGRYLYGLPDGALRSLPMASLAQLAQIVPSLEDRLPHLVAPVLDSTLGADENRQRLIEGVVAFLTGLARKRPLVFFLDDVQWADTESLAVLSRLSQRLAGLPLFVLLAYRSGDLAENEALIMLLHALKRTLPAPVFLVERFSPHTVERFLSQLTDRDDQPGPRLADLPALANILYETTRGNALFVTEALHALREYHTSHAPLTANATTLLPDEYRALLTLRRNQRVQEIILERIERLPAAALAVLQLSAVINRDFSLELLEAAALTDPIEGLEILLERRFLIERSDERLDFSHEVVRQVAYDSMSILQRRRLHQRAGDALVELGRAADNPSETAFHYGQAGRPARLPYARYSVRAGEKLFKSFGFRSAIEHFDDALFVLDAEQEGDSGLVYQALQGRALAYESLLDLEGMTEAYQRMQKWARQRGDRQLLLATYSRSSSMLGLMGQQRESNQLLSELFDVTATDTLLGEQSLALADLLMRRRHIFNTSDAASAGVTALPQSRGRTHKKSGSNEPAAPEGGWAAFITPPPISIDPVTALRQILDPIHAVAPLLDYGWTLRVQGQIDVAERCLGAVVDLAEETGQRAIASTAYHQLAVIAHMRGEVTQSQRLNEQSITINQQSPGVPAELASLWPRISSAFRALHEGQLDVAERRLRQVVDFLGNRNSFGSHRSSAQIGLGLIALEKGNRQSAHHLLTEALTEPLQLYPYTYVRALLGLARIAHGADDLVKSRQLLQRALRYAGERSLVEEYSEALLETVHLAGAEAPISQLATHALTKAEKLGVKSSVDLLQRVIRLGAKRSRPILSLGTQREERQRSHPSQRPNMLPDLEDG